MLRECISEPVSDRNTRSSLTTMFIQRRAGFGPPSGRAWIARGDTALHCAAHNKQPNSVKWLLSHGADIESQDRRLFTPLHCAAFSGSTASVKLLLDHGASKRALDNLGATPLMLTCRKGYVSMIPLLADPNVDTCIVDINGRSALHHATMQPDPRVFIDLTNAGWNRYQTDLRGRSPIFMAFRQTNFLPYIFASGADLSHVVASKDMALYQLKDFKSDYKRHFYRRFLRRLSKYDREAILKSPTASQTPLCEAAASGSIEYMDILLKTGADIEALSESSGTALITACLVGQLSSVRFLVRRGAKMDIVWRGRSVNALQAAQGNHRIVEWLLVGRYADQFKITADQGSEQLDGKKIFWSGMRQVEVPLDGHHARSIGDCLINIVRYWSAHRDEWRRLVPLDWDSVAHFTPTLEEMEGRNSED